jgi:hypothetical protein
LIGNQYGPATQDARLGFDAVCTAIEEADGKTKKKPKEATKPVEKSLSTNNP